MATITVSERAARHVSNYLQRQGHGIGVRLGIKTTGCSGFAYQLEYADEARAEDVVFEQHGTKLLIAPEHLALLARFGLSEANLPALHRGEAP